MTKKDFRLKLCPVCQEYWCFIHESMCSACKSKGYHVESRKLVAKVGFEREETKVLELPKVRKKHDD